MADAYGTLVFNHSEDALFEVDALIADLNSFRWASDSGNWIVRQNGSIVFDKERVQYPTVCARQVIYFVEDANNVIQKSAEEMTDKDWLNLEDEDCSIVQLAYLRDRIQRHIKNGWVQISCYGSQKREFFVHQLRVFFDGKITRDLRCFSNEYSEDYEELT